MTSLMGMRRRVMGKAEVAFSPADVAGLSVWLKADGITAVDGDPVATWPDSSGSSKDATQATAAKRPTYKTAILNGKPVVRFDGVDDDVATAAFTADAQPNSTFVVVSYDALTGLQIAFNGITGSDRHQDYIDGGGNQIVFAGANLGAALANMRGSFFISSVVWNGASSSVWQNGTLKATGNVGAHSLTGVTLGSDRLSGGTTYLKGDIAEFLLYGTALADADRDQIETYLGDKYGITVA